MLNEEDREEVLEIVKHTAVEVTKMILAYTNAAIELHKFPAELTLEEVAVALSLELRTVRAAVRKGQLQTIAGKKPVRVTRNAALAYAFQNAAA